MICTIIARIVFLIFHTINAYLINLSIKEVIKIPSVRLQILRFFSKCPTLPCLPNYVAMVNDNNSEVATPLHRFGPRARNNGLKWPHSPKTHYQNFIFSCRLEEGLNSSLAQLPGELCSCKDKMKTRDFAHHCWQRRC